MRNCHRETKCERLLKDRTMKWHNNNRKRPLGKDSRSVRRAKYHRCCPWLWASARGLTLRCLYRCTDFTSVYCAAMTARRRQQNERTRRRAHSRRKSTAPATSTNHNRLPSADWPTVLNTAMTDAMCDPRKWNVCMYAHPRSVKHAVGAVTLWIKYDDMMQ